MCIQQILLGLVLSSGGFAAILQTPFSTYPANGHQYAIVYRDDGGFTWDEARLDAISRGGYLATLTSAGENAFVLGLLAANSVWWSTESNGNRLSPWLGGRQAPGATEPRGGWSWVTGEPWDYTDWLPGEPNDWRWPGNFNNGEDSLGFLAPSGRALSEARWNDLWGDLFDPNLVAGGDSRFIRGYVLEVENPIPEPGAFWPVAAVLAAAAGFSRRRSTEAARRS